MDHHPVGKLPQSNRTKQQSWFSEILQFVPGSAARRARSDRYRSALDLYAVAVNTARSPVFYRDFGVRDDENGRFELIVLHLVLMVRALRGHGTEGKRLAQAMIDIFIGDMDRSLREAGVGDLSVGKKVKQMAGCYHARAEILEAPLSAGDAGLIEGLLLAGVYEDRDEAAGASRLARYSIEQEAALAGCGIAELVGSAQGLMPVRPG